VTGATGDWSDFSTQYMQMTESMLVSAQLAYVYPRMAELADLRGDHAFATQLRARASELRLTLAGQWTGLGWYARGYSGNNQIGHGAIFEEPQPWAILAGIPKARQATTLVQNVRRFLDGIGAPAAVRGPDRIGTSLSPARSDPGVTELTNPEAGVGDNNAVYQGGSWFAVNGWLTWALGSLDGLVPNAKAYAFDELRRNTLANHADVFPNHWNGTISVDDVCWSFYSSDPSMCSNGGSTRYDGQIMHQPAWALWDVVKLAGIQPTEEGYSIAPQLPFASHSISLPRVGVAVTPSAIRGFITPEAGGVLRMRITLPANARGVGVVTWAGGRRVKHSGPWRGTVTFQLPTLANRRADWAVTIAG
jgi:hypothetical protein